MLLPTPLSNNSQRRRSALIIVAMLFALAAAVQFMLLLFTRKSLHGAAFNAASLSTVALLAAPGFVLLQITTTHATKAAKSACDMLMVFMFVAFVLCCVDVALLFVWLRDCPPGSSAALTDASFGLLPPEIYVCNSTRWLLYARIVLALVAGVFTLVGFIVLLLLRGSLARDISRRRADDIRSGLQEHLLHTAERGAAPPGTSSSIFTE